MNPAKCNNNFKCRKPPISSSSWSFTEDERIVKYDHAWSIANFDRKLDMPVGQSLRSGKFKIILKGKPTEWYLEMYPNGEDWNCVEFVSLYLIKANNTPFPVKLEAHFYIVTDGVKTNCYILKDGLFDEKLKHGGWGNLRYVHHSGINLPDDRTFTVLCEMSLFGESVVNSGTVNHPTSSPEKELTNRLSLDMISLLESGDCTDCIIICKGREFQCHRSILVGRSSVFKAMLTHQTKEKVSGRIMIDDFEEETVYTLLRYLYSGNVENLEKKDVGCLLRAADKYDLNELKQLCVSTLGGKIDIENVCSILSLAKMYNCSLLGDIALQFVTENRDKIVKKSDWKYQLESHPDILARMFEALVKATNK